MSLQTLAPDSKASEIVTAIQRDGACIVRDVLDAETLARLSADVMPWLVRGRLGLDEYLGRFTKRIGALAARCPEGRAIITHPLAIETANQLLGPYCDRIQLNVAQATHLLPGEVAQFLHRDRIQWGGFLEKPIEPMFNTIWALSDFTEENGATHVIPGSHEWPLDRSAGPEDETVQAVMTAGSVLCYNGTVIHGGGANVSDAPRLGINVGYTLGWLRPEENMFLSCPPNIALHLDTTITDLLGYTMVNGALGYYSSPEMVDGYPDSLPPEIAIGRKPQSAAGRALIEEVPIEELQASFTREASDLGHAS